MQQEDDLRGLAKTMDFMRALSILFVVINIYWFCYGQIREWGINIGVVDRILLNFDRTAGLFRNILYNFHLPSACANTYPHQSDGKQSSYLLPMLGHGFLHKK